MQRSVSNDFEILERNSLSSSSISLVQSLDDLTPLPSPVYPTANVDNDDRHSFDLIWKSYYLKLINITNNMYIFTDG